jgi:hypothetical protein
MDIELKDYNVDDAIGILTKKCFIDNPHATYLEISIMFGVSERSLYRYMKKYKIETSSTLRKILKAKKLLEDSGYVIIVNK